MRVAHARDPAASRGITRHPVASRGIPWHSVALHGDWTGKGPACAASDVCINGVYNVACAAIE